MVHAVLVGIIRLPMLVTTLTKFYPVILSQALKRGLFAFIVVDQFSQVFILGGIDWRGVENRYQGHTLTQSSLLPLSKPRKCLILLGCCHVKLSLLPLFLRKCLILLICCHVATKKTGHGG